MPCCRDVTSNTLAHRLIGACSFRERCGSISSIFAWFETEGPCRIRRAPRKFPNPGAMIWAPCFLTHVIPAGEATSCARMAEFRQSQPGTDGMSFESGDLEAKSGRASNWRVISLVPTRFCDGIRRSLPINGTTATDGSTSAGRASGRNSSN